ncbi:MAG: DNA repair protein RecO [Armatimonadetes bacterium]|nr:DNA repair protein RecO [Armatimonadota bacterium]
MGLYKIEAVVLRRRNLGEADRLVTVLSRDRGKLVLAARGARRPRSRLGGRLEPPTRFRALVAEGRTLDVVSQVEVLDAHVALRNDLERMGSVAVVLEMADRALAERNPHPEVYGLLRDALTLLEGGHECAGLWFAARLLALTGHRPTVSRCPACGQRLRGAAVWSSALGGCVHATCASTDPRAIPVAPAALALLRFLLDARPPAVRRLAPASAVRSAVAGLLFGYAETCWETRLRSPAVVRALSVV